MTKTRGLALLALLSLPSAARAQPPYLLGPGDVMEVMVWKYEDISRVLVVDTDGTVTVPLAGTLMASGQTSGQVREEIVKRLSRSITNPQVTVILKQTLNNTASVLGFVNRPGMYPLYSSKADLYYILAQAGGVSGAGNQRKIQLLRHGSSEMYNLREMLRNAHTSSVEILPGDVIYVHKKSFFEPNLWQALAGGASIALIYKTFVIDAPRR